VVEVVYGFAYHTVPAPAYLVGPGLGEIAALAESAGFAGVSLTDHPAPSQAWREAGGHDGLDPFVGLAFAAAATTRVRLLTNLVVLPYRNPFHLAKTVATLDALSGGRVELGLGAGYLRSEFRALGVEWEERNALFDEAVRVLRMAWTGEPVAYQGAHFAARDTVVTPSPVQPGGPPLWIGGNSKLSLRRVVDLGAGWLPMPNARTSAAHLRSPAMETLDDFRELLGYARAYAARGGGRPPERVMYVLPDAHTTAEMKAHLDLAAKAAAAGATAFGVGGQGRTRAEAEDWIGRYGETVLRRLGEALS
jgi:probable F420-dependent oxidoreductase